MSANTLFFLNPDFDAELGGITSAVKTSILNELSLIYLVMSSEGDVVLSKAFPDDGFCEFLEGCGVSPAGRIISPEDWGGSSSIRSKHSIDKFVIWGISESALSISACDKKNFPSTDSVRELNSREYCHFLKKKYQASYDGIICYGISELTEKLSNMRDFPVVIKSFYGSSGTGMLVKNDNILTKKEASRLENFVTENSSGFVIEPWRERISDFSYGFDMDKQANVISRYFNILKNTEKGIFRSVLTDSGFSMASDVLDEKAMVLCESFLNGIAANAAEKKYSGYIGIDGYFYRKNGETCIEFLSEINARYTMARYVMQLKKRFSEKRFAQVIISRFCGMKINNYGFLISCLAENKFNAERGEGILLCSPLYYRLNGNEYKTAYLNFALFADSIEKIEYFTKIIYSIETNGCR